MNHPMEQAPRHGRAAVALALVAIALFSSGCDRDAEGAEAKAAPAAEHQEGSELVLTAAEAERAGIQVQALQAQAGTDVVAVTATIKANQDRLARVAPRVEGRLVRVSANLGDAVRAGQVLATLDSVALGEAQSALRQAQSAQRVAQADHQRAQDLAAEEIIPQREFLRAKAELEKASSELRAAQDKLRLLGAGGSESDFPLRSPLAGTVIEKKATAGELATPSEWVFTIADLSTLWIEANLTEDLLPKVKVGAPANVTVAAWPGERFAGKVTYIAGVLDPQTRTIPARIEVDNHDGRLKPEMFASATIETGAARGQVLSVPDAAIVLMQGQPTIFVKDKEGFGPRSVETGDRLGGRTVLKSGVQAGDQVVTAGAYALKARLLKSQISDEH